MQAVYQGIRDICHAHKVNIIGGDTVSTTGPLALSVTLIGEVEGGKAVLRSGAQVGDYIGVTNTLGASRVGLETLLAQKSETISTDSTETADFLASFSFTQMVHKRPEPQVKLGRLLATSGATALNDISDGLASELNEIAKASKVTLAVEIPNIPLHDEVIRWSSHGSFKKPYEYALYGGEDFQLVFPISEEGYHRLKDIAEITFIGRVIDTSKAGEVFGFMKRFNDMNGHTFVKLQTATLDSDDTVCFKVLPKGYNHF